MISFAQATSGLPSPLNETWSSAQLGCNAAVLWSVPRGAVRLPMASHGVGANLRVISIHEGSLCGPQRPEGGCAFVFGERVPAGVVQLQMSLPPCVSCRPPPPPFRELK